MSKQIILDAQGNATNEITAEITYRIFKYSLIIVRSRDDEQFNRAIASVINQIIPSDVFCDLVVIENRKKKKTIGKVLSGLGWELKGTRKKPKRVLAPSITSVIKDNEYVSEIFDKYPTNTYHQEVGLPAFTFNK